MHESRQQFKMKKSSIDLFLYNEEHTLEVRDRYQSVIGKLIDCCEKNYSVNSVVVQDAVHRLVVELQFPFMDPKTMLYWMLLAFEPNKKITIQISTDTSSYIRRAIEYYISTQIGVRNELKLIRILEEIVLSREDYLITSDHIQSLVGQVEEFYKGEKLDYCFSTETLMRRLIYYYGEPNYCVMVDFLYGNGAGDYIADAVAYYYQKHYKN